MAEPRTFDVLEATSNRYTAVITGNDGVTPLPAASLLTLTITLYVILQAGTDQIVNGRNQQNALNASNVTVDAAGLLVWTIQPADTALIEAIPYELHHALFEWTFATGAGKQEVLLRVRNLRRVP